MTYFLAQREAGRWVDGVWTVDHAWRCRHRHRTAESARACLKWPYPRVTAYAYREGEYGRIVSVGPDGESIVEQRLPDRFRERSCKMGALRVTVREWIDENPCASHPDYPFEVEVTHGAWSREWFQKHRADPVSIASAIHVCVVAHRPDALAMSRLAMDRPSNDEELDIASNIVVGPWKAKP